MLFLPLFAALLMADSPVTASADPLAPARTGQQQCYSPDAAKRTCKSLAGYIDNGDGTYANTATVLLSVEQGVTMTTVTQVHVVDGAVCGTVSKADIAAAQLAIKGQVLPVEQAQPVLAAVTVAMDSYFGQEVCTTYVPSGDALIGRTTLGGVARPDIDQPVIWVSATDGYIVGS